MAIDGKLLYHLTALENLESILQNGLKSRASLQEQRFEDVADGDILGSRRQHDLEQFVPFHFFAKNPFDYGVQRAHPDKEFVLITVRCTVAQGNNWKVVPRHPLAEEGYEILDYDQGMAAIDWTLIAKRDYEDRACKVACMAECLSPGCVPANKIFSIFVKTETAQKAAHALVDAHKVGCYINLAGNMFVGDKNV